MIESTPALPPDPDAFDGPRATRARARGLSAPYIPGGRDPDEAASRIAERRFVRILLAFVVVTILGGFVLGFLGSLFGS